MDRAAPRAGRTRTAKSEDHEATPGLEALREIVKRSAQDAVHHCEALLEPSPEVEVRATFAHVHERLDGDGTADQARLT